MSEGQGIRRSQSKSSRTSRRNSGSLPRPNPLQSPFEPLRGSTVGHHHHQNHHRYSPNASSMPSPNQTSHRPHRRRLSHSHQNSSQRPRLQPRHQYRSNTSNTGPARDIFEDPDAIMPVNDDHPCHAYELPADDLIPIPIRQACARDYKEVDANGTPRSAAYSFALNPQQMGSLFTRRTGSSEFVDTLGSLRNSEQYGELFDSVVSDDPSTISS